MACLIDACKAKVAILSYLAILCAVDHHALVARGTELLAVRVVQRQTDGFAAEPVACDTDMLVFRFLSIW